MIRYWKFFIVLFLIAGFLICPKGAYAWNDDMHYYLTYYLAKKVGFDDKTAGQIAGADLYTDYHPWMEANKSQTHFGREQKRLWHFPKWASVSSPDTEKDSFFSQINLYNALDSCDIFSFGIALHCFQDSWSHAGYGFEIGHGYDGHTPDMPYNYTGKAWETAKKTYEHLKKLYALRNTKDCDKCPDIEKLKKFLFGIFEYNPGYTCQECIIDCGQFDKAVDAMCENWLNKWEYGKGDNFKRDKIIKAYENDYGFDFEKRISFYGLPIGDKSSTDLDFSKLDMCSKEDSFPEMPTKNTLPPNSDEYGSILTEGLSSVNLIDKMFKKSELFRLNDKKVRAAISDEAGLQKIMEYAVRTPGTALELLYYFDPINMDEKKIKEYLYSYLNSKDRNIRMIAAIVLEHDYNDSKAKQLLSNEYANASPIDKEDPASIINWGKDSLQEIEKDTKNGNIDDQPNDNK
ncbi:MAG: hypothetical protein HQK79_02160 [Desulfobacterales bacterium]|nr:hypothetical protein [Desulfobacterales bacterium]MBF0398137.1 hypothetical protein [Desulfobacterales bacterium]